MNNNYIYSFQKIFYVCIYSEQMTFGAAKKPYIISIQINLTIYNGDINNRNG
jgi:hypothetical protein